MEIQTKTKNYSFCKILLYGFIFAVAVWIGFLVYNRLQKPKEVKIFIGNIINSVMEDTKFYQDNSDNDEIINLQNNRSIMSDSYTISIIDKTWGMYETIVLFENKTKFIVDVDFIDNRPYLVHFRRKN